MQKIASYPLGGNFFNNTTLRCKKNYYLCSLLTSLLLCLITQE
ncbi:hypothetical protein HMPREF1551_00888 [Capnocytophaga sp. oral taxon 863 str. F0517]|nr:hypothetical protein HMPREF1551_00888 [Capnocytophaga sp. oral taxon 863 str. F0517]